MKFELSYPRWQGEDEWDVREGINAKDVALQFASQYDSELDNNLSDQSITILVREQGSKEVQVINIYAEQTIKYHTKLITEANCKQCNKEMMDDIKAGKSMCGCDDRFCSEDCYRVYAWKPRSSGNIPGKRWA